MLDGGIAAIAPWCRILINLIRSEIRAHSTQGIINNTPCFDTLRYNNEIVVCGCIWQLLVLFVCSEMRRIYCFR